jgi:hypothetical protein
MSLSKFFNALDGSQEALHGVVTSCIFNALSNSMFVAELKTHPGRYAVSPSFGDEMMTTVSIHLAAVWFDDDQLKQWSRNHGDKWLPVEKP